MICQTCNESGIYNEVMGKGFYYCRTCKCEIELQVVETKTFDPDQYIYCSDWSEFDDEKYKTLTKGLRVDYFCF